MLSQQEFQSLAFDQQDEYVRAHGHYQAQRWYENYSVELYELPTFQCELWLEQECVQQPQYRMLTSGSAVELYASQELLPY
ncbi:hypothetical protein [Hymenobacter norwichensis]|uniref:hypothetical protein n=1 Tax=Hymenobacter norwichensis TaxID=223903 RepID=UPI0003B3522C|nr:hypothetical protein [Hymenobacter norwichensis]